MGLLKNVIMTALREQGIEAEWAGEKPRVLKTSAQGKYDDVRKVEKGYVQGVHRARKEAGND